MYTSQKIMITWMFFFGRTSKTILLFLLGVAANSCNENRGGATQIEEVGVKRVFSIPPSHNNPRNSEGDFVTLKNCRILYVYNRYTGEIYMDDNPAYLASRYSDCGGRSGVWFKGCRPALLCNDSHRENKFINWDPVNMKLV